MAGALEQDEAALRRLVLRYAQCVDRRDSEGFVALWAEGAVLEALSTPFDTPEKLAKVPQRLGVYAKTYHTVLNTVFEVTGDEAEGEIYSAAHHLTPKEGESFEDFVMYITYRDRYRRTAAGWRFARRQVVVEFTQTGTVVRKA